MVSLHRSQGCIYTWNWGYHNGRGKSIHPNSVSPCLDIIYKIIIPQGGHYKFGFGNGRINNAIASDGGSMSKITSSPRCAVQLQLTCYWMIKEPCIEVINDRNAISVSINATIQQGWDITVDTFAHYWGRKFYDGYSITLVWQ